jgi:hypothetical protein
MLEEEIKQRLAILESTNVEVQAINEYKQLKDELSKHQLSIDDPTRLLLILRTIRQIEYDPQKIVARFSYIKSLRQTEKGLKDNCKMLENGWLDVKMYCGHKKNPKRPEYTEGLSWIKHTDFAKSTRNRKWR